MAACRLLILIAKIIRQKLPRPGEPALRPLQTSLGGTSNCEFLFGERAGYAQYRTRYEVPSIKTENVGTPSRIYAEYSERFRRMSLVSTNGYVKCIDLRDFIIRNVKSCPNAGTRKKVCKF